MFPLDSNSGSSRDGIHRLPIRTLVSTLSNLLAFFLFLDRRDILYSSSGFTMMSNHDES